MDREEEKPQIHRPEYVVLEKEEPEKGDGEQNQYFQALSMLQTIKPSYGLRVVILLCLVLVSIAACVVVFFFLIHLLVAAVVLFQNKKVNSYLYQSWKNVKKLFVFVAGIALGFFSPSLGMGYIILYFMQEKIPLNKAILSRFFNYQQTN